MLDCTPHKRTATSSTRIVRCLSLKCEWEITVTGSGNGATKRKADKLRVEHMLNDCELAAADRRVQAELAATYEARLSA